MSAYGTIAKPTGSGTALSPTIWACKPNSKQGTVPSTPTHLTVYHLTLATALSQPGLIDHLRAIFTLDIEAGRTYPQETITGDGVFETYFFGADVFLGILGEGVGNAGEGIQETDITIDDSRQSRSWEDCVAGFYYVRLKILSIYASNYANSDASVGEAQLPRSILSCKSSFSQ